MMTIKKPLTFNFNFSLFSLALFSWSALVSFSTFGQNYSEEDVAKSRQSVVKKETEARHGKLIKDVRKAVARNVKMGPFTATSGIVVPFYLNAATNFMDPEVAPLIVDLISQEINATLKEKLWVEGEEKPIIVGMEMAGGLLAGQLAAQKNSPVKDWSGMVYVRKEQKKTGTAQQLEAIQKYTSRTPDSPLLKAIWVDDALSTGSSLLEGKKMLKEKYNIDVVAAIYLVDRESDRAELPVEKCHLAHSDLKGVEISALMSLASVTEQINSFQKK